MGGIARGPAPKIYTSTVKAVMSTLPQSDVIGIAREMFTEAYMGPAPEWSWFTNVEPKAGVLGTIEPLTAEQASRTVIPGGRSIAAHVEHLRWSLELVNRTIGGEPWQPDWSKRWLVQEVNDEQWRTLRANLRKAFDELNATLQQPRDLSEPMMLRGVFALAPHAAHHLGTIRTMAKVV